MEGNSGDLQIRNEGGQKNVNKEDFLAALRERLAVFPDDEAEEYVNYYREMIEDHIDDGFPEKKVIEALGSVDDVCAVILQETAITELLKKKVKAKRKLKKWQQMLLIFTSPIWFPVAIALAATSAALVLTLYIVLWSLILSLWAVEISLAACGLGAALAAPLHLLPETNWYAAGILFAGALVAAGLALILFFPCILATKGMGKLSGKIWLGIKFLIIGKEKRK